MLQLLAQLALALREPIRANRSAALFSSVTPDTVLSAASLPKSPAPGSILTSPSLSDSPDTQLPARSPSSPNRTALSLPGNCWANSKSPPAANPAPAHGLTCSPIRRPNHLPLPCPHPHRQGACSLSVARAACFAPRQSSNLANFLDRAGNPSLDSAMPKRLPASPLQRLLSAPTYAEQTGIPPLGAADTTPGKRLHRPFRKAVAVRYRSIRLSPLSSTLRLLLSQCISRIAAKSSISCRDTIFSCPLLRSPPIFPKAPGAASPCV